MSIITYNKNLSISQNISCRLTKKKNFVIIKKRRKPMKCSKCGADIDIGSKFCTYCGTVLTTEMAKQNAFVVMKVSNFYYLTARGLVVNGITNKIVKVGDYLTNKRTGVAYRVDAIEHNRKMKKEAVAGEMFGLLFTVAHNQDFEKDDELIVK